MRQNKILLSLSVLFILILSYNPVQVYSHLDKPDNPPIYVKVYVESVGLFESWDDWFDGNAELIVLVAVDHHYHDNVGSVITIDDFNWDYERIVEVDGIEGKERYLGKRIYQHIECSPMNDVTLSVVIKEDDSDTATTIISGVIAIVGGIIVTVLSKGTALLVAGGAGLSGIASLISGTRSVEELGSSALTVASPGTYAVKTEHGFVRFRVEVDTLSSSSYSCGLHERREAPTPTTTTENMTTTTKEKHVPSEHTPIKLPRETLESIHRSLDERLSEGERLFQELRGILRDIFNMGPEPGNTELTPKEIEADRDKLARTTLDILDPWILLVVKMGLDLSNASARAVEALDSLYHARDLASRGMYLESVDYYEEAWRLSMEIIFGRTSQRYSSSSLSIKVVDGDMDAVENVIVELYRDGALMMSTAPINGVIEDIPLKPGLYIIKVSSEILGFKLHLTSTPIEVNGPTTITIHISSILIPVDYIPVIGYFIIAFLISSTVSRVFGRGSLEGNKRIIVKAAIFLSALALLYYID